MPSKILLHMPSAAARLVKLSVLHVTLQCRLKSCHLSAAVRCYILPVSCECVPFWSTRPMHKFILRPFSSCIRCMKGCLLKCLNKMLHKASGIKSYSYEVFGLQSVPMISSSTPQTSVRLSSYALLLIGTWILTRRRAGFASSRSLQAASGLLSVPLFSVRVSESYPNIVPSLGLCN